MKYQSRLLLLTLILGGCDDTWEATEERAESEVQKVQQRASQLQRDANETARETKQVVTHKAETFQADAKATANKAKREIRQGVDDGRVAIEEAAESVRSEVDQIDKKVARKIGEEE